MPLFQDPVCGKERPARAEHTDSKAQTQALKMKLPHEAVQMFEFMGLLISHGPVAQWIRHRPTEPGIAGSSPAGVIFGFHDHLYCDIKVERHCKVSRIKEAPCGDRTRDHTLTERMLCQLS